MFKIFKIQQSEITEWSHDHGRMKILLYSKQKGKTCITKITLEPYGDTVIRASIVFNNSVDKTT